MSEVIYVSRDTFEEEVLHADRPVLVDFTAVWCGPCKMVDPIVTELAGEMADRMKVVKLDVDHNPDIAMNYNVMGVPTLMLFKSGQESMRLTGFQPKKRIASKLEAHLG